MLEHSLRRRRIPDNWEYFDKINYIGIVRAYPFPMNKPLDSSLYKFKKNNGKDKSLADFIMSLPDAYIAAIALDGYSYKSIVRTKQLWMFFAFEFYERFAEEFTKMALEWKREKLKNGSMKLGQYLYRHINMTEDDFQKFMMDDYMQQFDLGLTRDEVKSLRLAIVDEYYPPLLQKECERRNLVEQVKHIKSKIRTGRRLVDSQDRQKREKVKRDKESGIFGVYFLKLENSEPFIKIGFSTNIPERVRNIRQQMPYPIACIAIIPGADSYDERDLHNRFKDLKVKGEWFRPGERLLTFIDGLQNIESAEGRVVA